MIMCDGKCVACSKTAVKKWPPLKTHNYTLHHFNIFQLCSGSLSQLSSTSFPEAAGGYPSARKRQKTHNSQPPISEQTHLATGW